MVIGLDGAVPPTPTGPDPQASAADAPELPDLVLVLGVPLILLVWPLV